MQSRQFYYHTKKDQYIISLGFNKWSFLSIDADVESVDGEARHICYTKTKKTPARELLLGGFEDR